MELLFVNGCMRKESRTEALARRWMEKQGIASVCELRIGQMGDLAPLDNKGIVAYGDAVSKGCYDHNMFRFAKRFASASHILIAAPFWNFSLPAKLHDYLELVCTQGLTFCVDEKGAYHSLCHAQRLTFVMTSGGRIANPSDDHAFGLIRTLNEQFWHIPQLERIVAEGLDAANANVDALLDSALDSTAVIV